ncbi:MAG TPA: helix-turn-helix transcriptional regulator [Candidatus Baltobacteraceae bacterium]|nr:helix-turn-helix transcriptional regulator [Candidatus Baltobacteraceae bacterium]
MEDKDFEPADAENSLLCRITEAGQAVKAARRKARITSRDFAKLAGIDARRVGSIEKGHIIPPSERVEFFADILNLSEQGTRQLVATFEDAIAAKDLLRTMRERGIDLAPREAKASHIRVFRKVVIPELLQTPEYAESILQHEFGTGGSERKKRVAARIERQHILRIPTKNFEFVILESAFLARQNFGERVLSAQIDHIGRLQKFPNITIHVQQSFTALRLLPKHAGFQIFDQECVAVENSSGMEIRGQNHVPGFERRFRDFAHEALHGIDVATFLRDRKESYAKEFSGAGKVIRF